MLQMNCSRCGGLIRSPLLVEVQVIECPQCEQIVEVNNVVVSANKFSSGLRTSLKNLLFAAKDKFRSNRSRNLDMQTKYEIDKRLAKLLRRDDFRLDMSYDYYVQINFNSNKRLAKLLNVSSTGAAIEFAEHGKLPEINAEIKFQLLLPGHTESLSLLAKVVWSSESENDTTSKSITMGLQFKEIDEKIRSCLWDFIVNVETEDLT